MLLSRMHLFSVHFWIIHFQICSHSGSTPRYLVSRNFESKVLVKVPNETPVFGCRQPRSIASPHTSSAFSLGNLTTLRPPDLEIRQGATKNYCPMGLSDGSIGERLGNNMTALPRPKCSFHLVDFNIRTVSRRGKQLAPSKTLETFKIHVCCVS